MGDEVKLPSAGTAVEAGTPPVEATGGGAALGGKQPASPGPSRGTAGSPAEAAASPAPAEPEEPDEGPPRPDKNGLITLSKEAFMKRVRKESKRDLKAMFGTSDIPALQAQKKQYDAIVSKAEEERRKELSEREKLAEDLRNAISAKETAERRAKRAIGKVEVQKMERLIAREAREHVAPAKLDHAMDLFQAYARRLSARALAKLHGNEGAWFAEFVRKNPEYAPGAAPARGESSPERHETREREPANNGVLPPNDRKPPPKDRTLPSHLAGKTPRPNLPNSMTSAELREYASHMGIRIPQS